MKKIEDYLHLYMNGEASHIKSYVEEPDDFTVPLKLTQTRFYELDDLSVAKVKLVLRPLSDMTEEEKAEGHKLYFEGNQEIQLLPYFDVGHYELTRWFISKGFDLFHLIESGLAVEQKQIA